MKYLICVLVLVTVAVAEPPVGYSGRLARLDEAPYAPAGYRPSIPFNYPSRQQQLPNYFPPREYGAPIPSRDYGFPQQQYAPLPPNIDYGPPSVEYGPPEEVTEPEKEITTTEIPTTTETSTEPDLQFEKLKDKDDISEDAERQEGAYYIYHPSGLLQRIVFVTRNDLRNMAYSAQFKYQDVEPIRDPIFTYDPKTLQLKQISA